jgi:uncharacterized peroxidase-related enzyme
MHVHPIPPEDATGLAKELYDEAMAEDGYIANQTLLFSLNPAARRAWQQLVRALRGNMDLRRYELVTMAAARQLRCQYCVSAHAARLIESDILDRAQVEAITRDFRSAGLEPSEVAIMAFAEKLTIDANRIKPDDVGVLRAHGLTDAEIFDVTLAAAARTFYSKVLQAMDAEPDEVLADTNDLVDLIELRQR